MNMTIKNNKLYLLFFSNLIIYLNSRTISKEFGKGNVSLSELSLY